METLPMKYLFSTVLVASLAFGMLFAAGCQSASSGNSTHKYERGMMCPGCETVWVLESSGPAGRVNSFRSSRKMTCATCDKTAQAVLVEGGQVQLHNCPQCKVTPVLLDKARPKYDHRKTK